MNKLMESLIESKKEGKRAEYLSRLEFVNEKISDIESKLELAVLNGEDNLSYFIEGVSYDEHEKELKEIESYYKEMGFNIKLDKYVNAEFFGGNKPTRFIVGKAFFIKNISETLDNYNGKDKILLKELIKNKELSKKFIENMIKDAKKEAISKIDNYLKDACYNQQDSVNVDLEDLKLLDENIPSKRLEEVTREVINHYKEMGLDADYTFKDSLFIEPSNAKFCIKIVNLDKI